MSSLLTIPTSGADIGATTGTGSIVRATSPTIVTPTIASLENANHNHQNAAGGGALEMACLSDYSDDNVLLQKQFGSSIITQNCEPNYASTTINLTNSDLQFYAFWLPRAATLTGLALMVVTKGSYTANNNNRLGIYSHSAGTLTLVASCANDGDLWQTASTNTVLKKAFSSPYAAAAGVYFAALLYCRSSASTVPQLASRGSVGAVSIIHSLDYTNSIKTCGYVSGQTDLPASQALSGVAATSSGRAWVGVY